MSRLTNDIDAINQAVSQNVTSLIASVLSLVGILIAMFVLNHWLALATLLVVPDHDLVYQFRGHDIPAKASASCRKLAG